jgi:hypothetical protein
VDAGSGAELLRRAAALIRERATSATPGPWKALCDGYGDTSGGRSHKDRRDLLWVRSGLTNAGDVVTTYGQWTERSEHDVLHIAGMHPAVALAVADLLDAESFVAAGREAAAPSPGYSGSTYQALSIACAYLGEPVPS